MGSNTRAPFSFRRIGAALSGMALLLGLGCGGGTNNDQGTSFLALGFASEAGTTANEIGKPLPLASDPAATAVGFNGGTEGVSFAVDGLYVTTFIVLANNLTHQFIRVTRVDCSYDIPGADPALVIPNDSFNLTMLLGAAEGAAVDTPVDAAAKEKADLASSGAAEFIIVSPDLYSFINVNRNLLPELPFRMNVTCSAIGITQAGDVIRTNDIYYNIEFFDAAECCTGANTETGGTSGGFQNGSGTGGELTNGAGSATGDTTTPAA